MGPSTPIGKNPTTGSIPSNGSRSNRGAMDSAGGTSSLFFDEWMKHPTYDEFWRSCGYEQYWSQITVPALNMTGWWDMNFIGSPRNFVGMQAHGATPDARRGQRLVIGP